MITTKQSMQFAANDLRKTKPTAKDQRANPDINLIQVWLDDVEHTIKCKGWDAAQATEFRALCGIA